VIVLDAVGAGDLPDADEFGTAGSNTLGHVAEAVGGLDVPALQALGLGNVMPLAGCGPRPGAPAVWGRLVERSKGMDTTTGHWEMMGIVTEQPFPTFPDGFPAALIEDFARRTGRGVIGNQAASGTEIIQRLGEEHQRTGSWIVYTSADSVFQIAAHEDTVPVEELYAACRTARAMLTGEHAVGRVIARPFEGAPGHYQRTSRRRDFSLAPPSPSVLDRLVDAGRRVVTVGKVDDLFAGHGVSDAIHTTSNEEGEAVLLDLVKRAGEGLVFANLVDFDTQYGHRNDPAGFAAALERFDATFGRLVDRLRGDEMAWVTADHGNDPTTPGTDHTREYTPLLAAGPRVWDGADLGTRATFADLGATLAEVFSVTAPRAGESFLSELRA